MLYDAQMYVNGPRVGMELHNQRRQIWLNVVLEFIEWRNVGRRVRIGFEL